MRSALPGVIAVGFAVAVSCGCAATVTGEAYGPDLVYVSPGVQVIADYDEPIFYSDGYYWRSYGNGWYRSSHYNGGWGYYARPPAAIVPIDRPHPHRHSPPPPGRGGRPGAAAPAAPPGGA